MSAAPLRVAIVGSGISGLAAAHALHGQSMEWSGSAQTFCDAMNTLRSSTVLRAFVIPGDAPRNAGALAAFTAACMRRWSSRALR